ncbi:MAG: cupin domain-containing protein [Bacteroidetes bacterium]|nr:cupin domain-containing protein [Bacteroidota bacterium]
MSKVKINKLSDKEKREMGILTWPIWEKEISRFSWTYSENEQCYIIDGEFTIETDEGNFSASAGDFVIFKKGLSCVWDIRKHVKKYYNFS